jgi:tetratricopeptide (TPR) repeat protein
MGQIPEATKKFNKASDDLRQVCLKHPERIDLNLYRALCEYQLGHYDEAKKLVEFLIAVKPNEAVFHLVLAIVLEAQGNTEEAEIHRAKAKELDPNVIAPLV